MQTVVAHIIVSLLPAYLLFFVPLLLFCTCTAQHRSGTSHYVKRCCLKTQQLAPVTILAAGSPCCQGLEIARYPSLMRDHLQTDISRGHYTTLHYRDNGKRLA
jgi:hypothetical protein